MNVNEDLASDSDTSDEDYVPKAADAEVSEEESDGVPEEDTEQNGQACNTRKRKRRSKASKKKTEPELDNHEKPAEQKEETAEEKKKRVDSLWEDFKKDTGFLPKPKTENDEKPPAEEKIDRVVVTEVYEFAGEEVRVNKEVPANSAEARLTQTTSNDKKPVRGKARGGISSVLSQLGKKTKISTLEKSKLDWDQFKKDEKIEEELQAHNKGRDGYLERQDFLQRADLRQFEIEKGLRNLHRSNRI